MATPWSARSRTPTCPRGRASATRSRWRSSVDGCRARSRPSPCTIPPANGSGPESREMPMEGLRIAPVAEDEFESFLPLIAEYQVFYEAEPDHDRNRSYFRPFLAPSDHGLLIGAWIGDEPAGFTCLYFTGSSVSAKEIVLLSDL